MPIAKIFIIEDEAITALDIKKTLEKLNYEIVGIKDRGEDAIKQIDKLKPDIILMDISLKGELDGIETARILNIHKKIPIVYLTAHSDEETIERSKTTNPYGYLLKPLNDRDLNSCLRMALYRFETEGKLEESLENLKEARKMNLVLFDNLGATALIINSEGVVKAINSYASNEKFPTSHFPESNIKNLFPGKTGNKFMHMLNDALSTGIEQKLDHVINTGSEKINYETVFRKYSKDEVLAVFNNKNIDDGFKRAHQLSELKYRNFVRSSPFSITRLLIKKNKYEFVNDEFIKQSGLTLEQFNALSNKDYLEMIHADDRKIITEDYSKWLKDGCKGVKNLVYRIINARNETIWLDSYHFADINADGSIEAVNQIYLNINKQKEYEEVLAESKQHLDALFQQSLDGIFIAKIDPPVKWIKGKSSEKTLEHIIKNVKIIRANEPLAEQFGVKYSEVYNISSDNYYGEQLKDVKKRWREFLDRGFSHVAEYYNRKDGSKIFIEGDYYCLYDTNNNFSGYIGVQRDMTDRQKAADLIKLSEEKFRAVAESMPAQIVIFQDNRFVYANPYSEVITGYSIKELLRKNFWDLVHEDFRDIAKDRGVKRLLGEDVPESYELKIITKDNKEKWLNYSAKIVEFNGKKAVLGIATDITDIKKSQEKIKLSEEKYRNFVEHSSEGIYRLEFKTPIPVSLPADEQIALIRENIFIAECNSVFSRMYDIPDPKDIIGQNINKLKYTSSDVSSRILKFITQDYNIIEDEVTEYDENGNEKYFVINISGVIEHGLLTSIWGVQRDISEKKRFDEALKKSLAEKEILLKEIHHRVKNNLQIVTSLLKLQAGYVNDDKIKQLFRESQNRVQSMSLIHQKLYQSKDLGHIDFKEYIETVSTHLQHSYGILEDRVVITTDVSNMIMSIDNAIPAGLIINELVSNSLKHAFPGGKTGNIFINAAYDNYNKEYWFVVRDNGIGIKQVPDLEKSASFGLKLVNTLVKQLDGIIEIVQSGGTEFRIHFKNADYRERNN